jgi:hypothetical protein
MPVRTVDRDRQKPAGPFCGLPRVRGREPPPPDGQSALCGPWLGATGCSIIGVEPFHLFRYLDERVFTYNLRDRTDYGRFEAVLNATTGRRLTYAEVTGQD